MAERCGGCAWIARTPADQAAAKRERVCAALAAFPSLQGIDVDPCRPARRPWAYRNRAKFAVRAVEGAVRLGLFRRGTADVVDVGPCPVQTAATLELLERIRAWLATEGSAAPAGAIRHIDLREGADASFHLTLVLATEPGDAPTLPWERLTAAIPELVGLSVNFQPHESSYTFGPVTRTVHGRATFDVDVDGPDGVVRRFEVPATGFFQVATEPLGDVHAALYRHLAGAADESVLFDLYCGVGLHGLVLADLARADGQAWLVEGVESSTPATSCARRNAHRLGIAARYHRGPAEKLWPRLAEASPGSAVLLNPGRSGARPAVLDAVARYGRRAGYVSCEPSTLARDLERLVTRGWSIERLIPFDLMPQTDQVETLALLVRGRR